MDSGTIITPLDRTAAQVSRWKTHEPERGHSENKDPGGGLDDQCDRIHLFKYMKTISVNVSEPVYEDFQRFAEKMDRKASELIREAMEAYRQQHMLRRTSLRDRRPASVGGPIKPITAEDDLLGEMLHDLRD